MKALRRCCVPLVFLFAHGVPLAWAAPAFDVVVLGARGGIEDGNLSAYLIRPVGDPRAVTCDAGALVNGLQAAQRKGALDDIAVPEGSPFTRVGYTLNQVIQGYLISHAHLDHVAGLVAASPDDSRKPIYALPSVHEVLQQHVFNWAAWPNFADRGKAPQLQQYRAQDLTPGQPMAIDNTGMRVTAFPLSHGGVESTAFLIEKDDDALLCFGDTGPDAVERSPRMRDVWQAVAQKVQQRRLRAIIVETSYADPRPEHLLFGHLTPNWLLKSLRELDALAGGQALVGLPVVIGHIKFSLKTGEQPEQLILQQLQNHNDLGVRFIVPQQGDRWGF